MKDRGKTFFNNSFNETGYIKWQIKSGKDKTYKGDILDGSLIIADCNSNICLDFDCEEAHQVAKRIEKLDVMITELNRMREALVKANTEITTTKKFYY